MRKAVAGGIAAVCLVAVAASAGAQIHNNPVTAPRAYSSAPPPRPVAATVVMEPRRANWRSHRFHDCMKRYHDRKGCYYLAWHKHHGHGDHAQSR